MGGERSPRWNSEILFRVLLVVYTSKLPLMNCLLKAFVGASLAFIAHPVYGQITPDGSLPTQVQNQGKVTEITGGQQAGSNLFHSFEDFSVRTGNEAWFNNAVEIDNILSRVTGGNISSIDGLIRANGTANLFLINPAGIVFGDNARLSIGGSFFGSTATGITFEDGTKFGSNNTAIPSLTINAPIGLDLRNATGNISSTGKLKSDRNLTLSGNNLNLQGQVEAGQDLILEANNNLTIRDTVASPFLAKAGQELSLQSGTIDIFVLDNSASELSSNGDLILKSDNPVSGDAHYSSGGNFRIEKLDGTLGDLISLHDPIIFSQSDVSLASYEGASLHIQSGGNVTIEGDVTITGVDTTENSIQETVTLTNGSQIEIDGNAEPTLDIRAGTNSAAEAIQSPQLGSDITISGTVNNAGGKVFLTNQYQPNSNSAAGDITVAEINTSNSTGNGGDAIVDSRNDINIANGIDTSSVTDAQLTTQANLQTFPQVDITAGNGGAIALFARNNINVGDTNSFSQVNLDLNTEVNTIDEANNIFAIPQARVSAGAGGEVNLQAGRDINLGNVNSSSTIAIDAESTAVDSFSIITALLELNTADGGKINLVAGNDLTTNNLSSNVAVSDRLISSAETTPEITLTVSQIGLTIARSEIGSGGDIFLQAGSKIDTGSLDSSVSVTNIADNRAFVLANNSQTATTEIPARVNSQIDLAYEDTSIGKGGEISLNSDRASTDNINSSISATSQNTVFAEANAENDAAADAIATSDNNLDVTGDRPGNITFKVSEGVNFDTLNASAIASNGINNLDSVAFADSENAIATANADGTNMVDFITQSDSVFINFNFNVPDVDLAIDSVNNLPLNSVRFMAFDACPVNTSNKNQLQPIETARGLIYPATGVINSGGQIRLIARPDNRGSRDIISVPGCN